MSSDSSAYRLLDTEYRVGVYTMRCPSGGQVVYHGSYRVRPYMLTQPFTPTSQGCCTTKYSTTPLVLFCLMFDGDFYALSDATDWSKKDDMLMEYRITLPESVLPPETLDRLQNLNTMTKKQVRNEIDTTLVDTITYLNRELPASSPMLANLKWIREKGIAKLMEGSVE